MAYKSELGDITKYVTVDNIVYLLMKLKSVEGGFIASNNYIGGFKTGFVDANTRRGVKLTEGHQAYIELWPDPEQKEGNVGANNRPIYFEHAVPKESTLNAGTTTKPVYFKDGVITECEDIGQMLKNILDPSVKNIKFNQTHKRLEIKTDIKTSDEAEPEEATFVTETLTKLEKPDAPHIDTTTYNLVSGNAQVSVQNKFKFAATLYYRIKATEWGAWNDLGSTASTASKSFNIASGYTNDKVNDQIVKNIQVKAIYKGEESDVADFVITIKPKVAKGSISVSPSSTSSYGKTLTVKVNPSATPGATSEYSKDGGTSWKAFTQEETIISESTDESVPETHKLKVKVRATRKNHADKKDYVDADQVSNTSSYTIGQRMVYYGFSTEKTLANITDIKALKDSGGSLAATTIEKGTVYSIKPDNFKNTSPYIWICMTGTLDPDFIFANAASVIPMGFNKAIQVGGWNCYRLTSTVTDLDENTTFVLK